MQVHSGIYSGQDDGSVWILDVKNNGAYSKLYDTKGAGTAWSIVADNKLTEMKVYGGTVY